MADHDYLSGEWKDRHTIRNRFSRCGSDADQGEDSLSRGAGE